MSRRASVSCLLAPTVLITAVSKQGRRGVRPALSALLAALWSLVAIAPTVSSVGPSIGGHFRAGSLSWTKLQGNAVQFELLSSWKRSHSGNLVNGVPAQGRIFIGDRVRVSGQDDIQLDFGDGAFAFVDVDVQSYSESGDWFEGITIFNHTYASPNNGWRIDVDRYGDSKEIQGWPWMAEFRGCCRWDGLANEANEVFKLKATFDLIQLTNSPGARSLGFTTACENDLPMKDSCKIPGSGEGPAKGPCAKVPFTTQECGNAQSTVGKVGSFMAVPLEPIVPGIIVEMDGTIRTPLTAAQCLPLGQYTAGIALRDGTVGFIKIVNPGMNCPASGNLIIGITPKFGSNSMSASFESENGRLKKITITNPGSGYTEMPKGTKLQVPLDSNFPCTGAYLEGFGFETQVNILVGSVKRHTNDCYDTLSNNAKKNCGNNQFVVGTNIMYRGTVIPQFLPNGFPGVGFGYDAVNKRVLPPLDPTFDDRNVNGGTGKQDAYGHVMAYAGYELSLTFNASVNWCQLADMSVLPQFVADERCVVKGTTVTYRYGPLPKNVRFSMRQTDAITNLMLTYDNPFESHRPNHEWTFSKLSREYVNHPSSLQAAQLGFTRIDFNLNSGVGGASVYLWFKRYDPAGPPEGKEAITHLNISTNAQEELHFKQSGYTKLEGSLNEQAGGSDVFIWYKKSSGNVMYSAHRPTQMGQEMAITNITFASILTPTQQVPDSNGISGVNRYYAGTDGQQTAPGWVRINKDLNAGTVSNSPINLFWRRSQANPTSHTLFWRPCACDVGRQYICVSPQTSQLQVSNYSTPEKVTGEERCVAIDVLPDDLPKWKSPSPQQVMEFFMGRETRYPLSVIVSNPDKEVQIEACVNLPNFLDSDGDSCAVWAANPTWCSGSPEDGVIDMPSAYKNKFGVDPAMACCTCGGGSSLPSGAGLDVMMRPGMNCSFGLCYDRSRDLAWTPAWNQGGLRVDACFKASDMLTGCEPAGQANHSMVCVTLIVARCVYAINYEQHVQELASLFKTDWLNIYSMNPTIKTPDRLLFSGQLINIGHLYSVVPGDSLSKVAKVILTRFWSLFASLYGSLCFSMNYCEPRVRFFLCVKHLLLA